MMSAFWIVSEHLADNPTAAVNVRYWRVVSTDRRNTADSDEAGHAFQSEAGRYSELMPARYSDAKPAT